MTGSGSDRIPAALLWIAAGLGCGVAAAAFVQQPGPNAPLLSGLASQGLWIGLAVGLATLCGPGSIVERLGLGPARLRVPTFAALLLGLAALSNGASALLAAQDLRDTGSLGEIDGVIARAQSGPSFALALLALGVAPGIGEEILFRGLVQRALVVRVGSAAGVLLAALLFGAAHLDAVHGAAACLLGAYLGCVAWLAGSTRAAIACHVVNNTLAVASTRLPATVSAQGLGMPPEALAAALLPLAALLLAAAVGWELWARSAAGGDPTGPLEPPEGGGASDP